MAYPKTSAPSPPIARGILALGVILIVVATVAGVILGRAGSSAHLVDTQFQHFTGQTVAGAQVDTRQFEGNIILVDFWASWCGPCIQRMPDVMAAREKYADRGLEVIGVSADYKPEALAAAEEKLAINFPTIYHGSEEVLRMYGINTFPTIMIVDRDGRIAYSGYGSGWKAVLESLI